MEFDLSDLKKEIRSRISNVKFKTHFYDKVKERPYLSESLIIDSLKRFDEYLGFQTHEIKGEERQRVAITLSGKYNLVIVLVITNQSLNIITAWKTNRRWQKAMQK